MSPAINIVLHKDGTVTVFPEGIKGKRCVEFSRPFEEALGMTDDKRKKKPEFFQEEKTVNKQHTSG